MSVQLHYIDSNKMLRETARLELLENAVAHVKYTDYISAEG